MNNIFNPGRFARLAAKTYTENFRSYLIGLLAAFIVVFFSNWFMYTHNIPVRFIPSVSIFIGAIIMLFFVQMDMRIYRKKSLQMNAHLLPASTFEKYFFVWVNSLIVFWIFFIGAYHLSTVILETTLGLPAMGNRLFDSECLVTLIKISIFHAIILFSNAYIKRNPILGYILTTAAMGIVIYLLNLPTLLGLVNSEASPFPPYIDLYPMIKEGSNSMRYIVSWLNADIRFRVETISMISLILLYWTCGYYKFKERQLK